MIAKARRAHGYSRVVHAALLLGSALPASSGREAFDLDKFWLWFEVRF